MKARTFCHIAAPILMALAASACDTKPPAQAIPEVNDQNCLLENIRKIEDKGAQQDFAGQCARRGAVVKRSAPRTW